MIIYTVFVTSYTNGVENDYTALPFKQHSVFAPRFLPFSSIYQSNPHPVSLPPR